MTLCIFLLANAKRKLLQYCSNSNWAFYTINPGLFYFYPLMHRDNFATDVLSFNCNSSFLSTSSLSCKHTPTLSQLRGLSDGHGWQRCCDISPSLSVITLAQFLTHPPGDGSSFWPRRVEPISWRSSDEARHRGRQRRRGIRLTAEKWSKKNNIAAVECWPFQVEGGGGGGGGSDYRPPPPGRRQQ